MAEKQHPTSETIAQAALALPVGARDRFISERCEHDPDRIASVERWMRRITERALGGYDTSATTSHSVHAEIGQLINDEYEILDEIGRGGYGIVYRCRELSLGGIVAVKMLFRNVRQQKALEQFREEGRRLALLNHSNVIQVHRAGAFEDRPFIVMEYIDGKTLRETLGESGSLPSRRGLNLLSQVTRGLHEIHENGLIHRDLSARNVMVTRDGTVKILDLGLSRFVDATDATRSSTIRGTPAYLAPELFDGELPSYSSDIFALGVLMYETIVGINPFHATSTRAIVDKLLHHDPELIDARVPGLPGQLVRLVESCLEKSPRDRLVHLGGVAEQLERCAVGDGSSEDHPTPAAPVSEALANPYLNRVMIRRPAEFVGRRRQVRKVLARLNANPPGSISIEGDRRIGKSSLLNYVALQVQRDRLVRDPQSLVVVFIDLQRRDQTLPSFLEDLITEIRRELVDRQPLPDVPPTLEGLRRIVDRIHGAGYRLVILLDEFERITHNENFPLEFFSFLRSLVQRYNIGYITSSVRDLQSLCHTKEIAESPFFNIFTPMRLGAFEPSEARELVVRPSSAIGIELEPFFDFVADELAGHFPMFVQIACSHLVDAIQDEPDGAVDLKRVRHEFESEAEPHFRFLWESFDDAERTACCHLVRGHSVPEPVRYAKHSLESRDYLRTENGHTGLFSKAFARFVRASDPRAERDPLWQRVTAWTRRS